MRRITAVTALSVAGVLLAAGTAAALNAQVLGGPSRTSVGTADTLLPDDPFVAPTVGDQGGATASDDPSASVEPTESAEPTDSASPSASRPSRTSSPSTVPSTGGGSTTEPGDDKGGSDGSSGSSGDSGSSGSSGGGDDKPDDD